MVKRNSWKNTQASKRLNAVVLQRCEGAPMTRPWIAGRRRRGLDCGAPKARPEDSQGPARSAPPLGSLDKKFRPERADRIAAPKRVCRPLGAARCVLTDPGAASRRFASELATGYLLNAPSALLIREISTVQPLVARIYRPATRRDNLYRPAARVVAACPVSSATRSFALKTFFNTSSIPRESTEIARFTDASYMKSPTSD